MYETTKVACRKLNVHPNTLRNWSREGKIVTIRTPGNQRRYDVEGFLGKIKCRRMICYCRVSSYKQKDDLARQVSFMKEKYPKHEIIQDIGSGLNFKRKGFKAILELANKGEIRELVVAHKDRLCRFGFEIIEWLINKQNGKIVVLDKASYSPQDELTRDLLTILHVFSCRINGLRKYHNQIKKDTNLS